MRHEEREREDYSEPTFGAETPIVSPYPRPETTQELAPLKLRITSDLFLVLLGGAIAALSASRPTGPATDAALFVLSVFWVTGSIYGNKKRLLVPHQALGMAYTGFLLTIAFFGGQFVDRSLDGPQEYSTLLVLYASVLSSIVIVILAGIQRFRGTSVPTTTYDILHRGAASVPIILLLSIIYSVTFLDPTDALPVAIIAAPYWALAIGWSFFIRPKLSWLLLFGAFHALACVSILLVPSGYTNQAFKGVQIALLGTIVYLVVISLRSLIAWMLEPIET